MFEVGARAIFLLVRVIGWKVRCEILQIAVIEHNFFNKNAFQELLVVPILSFMFVIRCFVGDFRLFRAV